MLVSDVPVAALDGVEPITLRCHRPLIIVIEGILGIGKSFATAYGCIRKPQPYQQLGLWGITLREQKPDYEPLYVNTEVGGEKSGFWYVQEEVPPLGLYYNKIERFVTGRDKEPNPVIGGVQIHYMEGRRKQVKTLIPEKINEGYCLMIDRGPEGDRKVFGQNLIDMGAIRGNLLKEYELLSDKTLDLWNNMKESLGVDIVSVYLLAENPETNKYPLEATKTTAEIAFMRKDVRNRSAEKSVTPDYMYRLNDLYNNLFGRNPSSSLGPIVRVNTGLDLEVNPKKEVELLRVIAECICDTYSGVELL